MNCCPPSSPKDIKGVINDENRISSRGKNVYWDFAKSVGSCGLRLGLGLSGEHSEHTGFAQVACFLGVPITEREGVDGNDGVVHLPCPAPVGYVSTERHQKVLSRPC